MKSWEYIKVVPTFAQRMPCSFVKPRDAFFLRSSLLRVFSSRMPLYFPCYCLHIMVLAHQVSSEQSKASLGRLVFSTDQIRGRLLLFFLQAFRQLRQGFPEEYAVFGLAQLVPAMAAPVIKRSLAGWTPLQVRFVFEVLNCSRPRLFPPFQKSVETLVNAVPSISSSLSCFLKHGSNNHIYLHVRIHIPEQGMTNFLVVVVCS